MHTAISGSAKAVTPFGPLAGRTPVTVADQGEDSIVVSFHCGSTPVMLALAGDNYLAFVRTCIAHAAPHQRASLTEALAVAVAS